MLTFLLWLVAVCVAVALGAFYVAVGTSLQIRKIRKSHFERGDHEH